MLLADVVPASITLFGDSAGANLAAGVSLMAASRGEFMPNTQMLLYPSTNFDHTAKSQFESIRTNGEDYLLTSRDIEGYMEMYQSCKQDRYNPWLAPLLSTSLAGQPRTLVITAEYCPLRDEGEAYAWRLQEAGCAVQCYRMADAIHGYLLYPSFFGIVKETYNIIRHFLDGDELKQEGGRAWLAIFGTALTT
jgi:acetyl esterase/lipase